jgi:hypothetical protein
VAGSGVNGVGGNTGVWRSTDGGLTWINTTTSISTVVGFSDLEIDPSNPNILYAAAGSAGGDPNNGVYKTINAGTSWAIAGNIPAGIADGRITTAISPSNPRTIYAAIVASGQAGSGPRGQLYRMLRSNDGGNLWTDVTSGTPNYLGDQGDYDSTLAVDPSNPNVVYAGGSFSTFRGGNFVGGIIASVNGGVLWTDINVGADGIGPHVDFHASGFDASGRLLVGNDGGIYRLQNAALSSIQWSDLNTNLQTNQFVGIALDPSTADIAYGGTQDNGTNKFNDALGWNHLVDGDGGFVRVDQTNPNTVYQEFFGINLQRSDDGGATFTPKITGINVNDPSNFYVPYVMDPSNSNRLLYGTNRVYETLNRGDLWAPISTPNANGWNSAAAIDTLATAATDPNTIYAAASGLIFVTTNRGLTWQERDIPGATDSIVDLQVDPTNSRIAYAVRDRFNSGLNFGQVFRTTDGGLTWANITGNLPPLPAYTLEVDLQADGSTRLFVGNDTGVYASSDLGVTWSRFRTGLPNVQVRDLELSRTQNILAAGTYGRGLWETPSRDTALIQLTLPTGVQENVPLVNVVVATFTDTAGPSAAPASSYTATIAWGDGTSSPGVVADDGTGGFLVSGSHTYDEGGSYPITVTVTRPGLDPASASDQIDVVSAPLSAVGGRALTASEGTSLGTSVNPQAPQPVLVATFLDADPGPQAITNYTVRIDWGDGTSSNGELAPASGGGYAVSADHTYDEGGSYIFRVFISEPGGNTATVTGVARVSSFPLTADPGQTFNLVEGVPFSGTVASFRDDFDPSPSDQANYSATIDWGDGTSSPGTITPTADPRAFDVRATHTFAFRPDPYAVLVTIREGGGNTVTVLDAAAVVDAPIAVSPANITTTEGATFRGIVASFLDSNARGRADQYAATVSWGDGTTSDTSSPDLTITADRGVFQVSGRHAYAATGVVPLRVDVLAVLQPGGSGGSATGSATVTDAPLTARGTPVIAQEGTFRGTVATFTDANARGRAEEFTAAIDWGDGTSSAGVVTPTGPDGTGPFLVAGVHDYAQGSFPVLVTIQSLGGSRAVARGTAIISGLPVTALGRAIAAVEAQATGPILVATFTDANPSRTAASFTAAIAWGDGTSSAGTVAADPAGGFAVLGQHTYAAAGDFAVLVTILDTRGVPRATAGALARVTVRVVPLSGGVGPLSDGGASDADGVTAEARPTLQGTAAPGSTITVSARGPGGAGPVLLGSTTADDSGLWSLTVGPLADGAYSVSATSSDAAGRPNSPPTLLGPLVIDTTGPAIAGITLEARRGRVLIRFRDAVGGLDPQGLLDASNYTLTASGRRRGVRTGTSVAVVDGQTVAVTFANGRRLASGTYVLTVAARGLTDRAGNALDEQSLVDFPQINVRPGGDLVAVIDTNGRRSSAPRQFVPGSALDSAAAFREFLRERLRRRRR